MDSQASQQPTKTTTVKDNDSDDDGLSLESLFICEDYVEKTWHFRGGVEVPLLCSVMSSTDHDLTGQIVWPASVALACYITANTSLFSNKVVLELGAGCGLGGFTAAKVGCKTSIITDGNDVVMRLLDRNKNKYYSDDNDSSNSSSNSSNNNNSSSSSSSSSSGSDNITKVITKKLLWGLRESMLDVFNVPGFPFDSKKCPCPEVIIGADVVLWPTMVAPLVLTLRWLLLSSADRAGRCYISYIVRAKSTTELFLSGCLQSGLLVEDADPNAHIPDSESAADQSLRSTEKRMFIISLIDPNVGSIVEELTKEEAAISSNTATFLSNSAPC